KHDGCEDGIGEVGMAVVRSSRGAVMTRPYSFALISTGTSAISEKDRASMN
ncbi:unnamed protein product, partial [Musa textilis]